MTETIDYKQMPADVLLNITSASRASAQADDDIREVLFEQLGYLIEFFGPGTPAFRASEGHPAGNFPLMTTG